MIRVLALLCVGQMANAQGYSLVEPMDDLWRRVEDRHGRPDPDGALLQFAAPLQYIEYAFDRQVMRWPLQHESEWVAGRDKARFFVHSLNEFTLTNELQLDTGAPIGDWGRFRLRLDRVERREGQSTLVRTDFGAEDIAGSGWFTGIGLTPRWEKEDVDVELFAGVEGAAGRMRLRLFFLDAFVDAAHALAEGRGEPAEVQADQQDLPLAWGLDFQSARFHGFRAEVYGGVVLPAATRYRFRDGEEEPFERTQEAVLGGGLLEWQGPVVVGVAVTQAVARTRWTGGREEQVEERFGEQRAYVVAGWGAWDFTADITRTDNESEGPETHHEIRLLSAVRGFWQPGPVGLELGLFRADRDVVRSPRDDPEGAEHRFVTRVLFQLDPRVRIGLGTGWDLDPGDGIYDGSGFTLVAQL